MSGGRFVPNRNFERQFTLSAPCRTFLDHVADAVIENAKHEVNIDQGFYNRSFVKVHTPDGVIVGNTDFAAHIIEWGRVGAGPQAPLRRGSRATGLRLDESDN